jgi:HAD superfamily hydrolase (TIGR01457 family)
MLVDRYDAVLFDLDGVLYRGPRPIPHAADAVARLRARGTAIAFVTNNSARTPEAVAQRLRGVGVGASADEVETSAHATAHLLASRGVATVFVVGEEGIRSALADAGIRVLDDEPAQVDAVVVGFDRTADYAKLRAASVLVERGAALTATNPDGSFPAEDGFAWPGAGALLAAIETTTGIRAEVVGKPHAPVLEAALTRAGGTVPLVVGDRLDTDVAGAAGLGWDSLLVLTGISTRAEAEAAIPGPTYIAEDLRGLFGAPA